MAERLVSRRAEEQALVQFLALASSQPCALIVEGDPGIDKTTLWLDALTRARGRGFRVLTTRAAVAESVLAYTALADLLSDVDESMWADLPGPQRHGVDAALPSPDTVRRIRMQPLTVGELHQVIMLRLGTSLARPMLLRIHEIVAAMLPALQLGEQ
jgi:hypothetical protein